MAINIKTFQSTPGYLAGRYARAKLSSRVYVMFQSTPGYLAGRYMDACPVSGLTTWFQSTPGYLAGRYEKIKQYLATLMSFNPLPAI